jgi:hypothetical protein
MRTAIWLGLAVFAAIGLIALGCDAKAQTTAPAKPEAAAPVIPPAVKIPKALPPDVAFGRFIALIRGHMLTGDELVRQRDWNEAHRHFMFPLEEIYGVIRENLQDYHTPPFDGALKALARAVAAHDAKQYPKAREKVESALAAADADLKSRQANWPRFVVQTAIAVLKTAPEEYADAVANDRIVHPVGYQTARGFILQADRMIESVAGDLEVKSADALRDMRDAFSQLKQAFNALKPPKRPPIELAAMQDLVARIELSADKLM